MICLWRTISCFLCCDFELQDLRVYNFIKLENFQPLCFNIFSVLICSLLWDSNYMHIMPNKVVPGSPTAHFCSVIFTLLWRIISIATSLSLLIFSFAVSNMLLISLNISFFPKIIIFSSYNVQSSNWIFSVSFMFLTSSIFPPLPWTYER